VDITDIDKMPVLLTVEEAAQIVRKGKNFIYNEVKEKRIPHVMQGCTVRILRDKWLRGVL